MATIINNPDTADSGATGMIMGIVLAIVIVVLFFFYGLPALRGTTRNTGTNINVPDKVDVNVNQQP